jgi:hypothetical protein
MGKPKNRRERAGLPDIQLLKKMNKLDLVVRRPLVFQKII